MVIGRRLDQVASLFGFGSSDSGNRYPPNSSSFVSFTRFTQLHPGLIHFLLGLNTSFGTQFQLLDIAHQCSPYFSSPMLEAWYCTRCPPVMSKLIFTCLSHIPGLSIKIKHQKPIIQSYPININGNSRIQQMEVR